MAECYVWLTNLKVIKNIGTLKGEIKMPVFYILVFIAAILLWFLLAFMFKPMGKLGHKVWQDAVDAINEEENENKKEQ